MGKGYAEGPATEERLTQAPAEEPPKRLRQAVYGSTDETPERHFIGWIGDVDPEDLFSRGTAWGLSVVARAAEHDI